jgi:hypothetical protein
LTVVAASDAVGITSEATTDEFPDPVSAIWLRDAPHDPRLNRLLAKHPPAGAAMFRRSSQCH